MTGYYNINIINAAQLSGTKKGLQLRFLIQIALELRDLLRGSYHAVS